MKITELSDSQLQALVQHYKLPLIVPESYKQRYGSLPQSYYDDVVAQLGQLTGPQPGGGQMASQAYFDKYRGQGVPPGVQYLTTAPTGLGDEIETFMTDDMKAQDPRFERREQIPFELAEKYGVTLNRGMIQSDYRLKGQGGSPLSTMEGFAQYLDAISKGKSREDHPELYGLPTKQDPKQKVPVDPTKSNAYREYLRQQNMQYVDPNQQNPEDLS